MNERAILDESSRAALPSVRKRAMRETRVTLGLYVAITIACVIGLWVLAVTALT